MIDENTVIQREKARKLMTYNQCELACYLNLAYYLNLINYR